MHTEQSPQKQQNGDKVPARRKVRSLLGLPERETGSLHGQTPVPPGAFRYQSQSGLQAPLTPVPMSVKQSVLNMIEGKEQLPSGMARSDSPQVDRQAAENAQSLPQQPAQGGARPLAVPAAGQAHQPSEDKTGQHAQQRTPASLLPDQVPVITFTDGTEGPGQPAPDSRPTACGNRDKGQGNRQEMAIPGRSTVRQAFTALTAAADGENPLAADQPPAMAQHAAPLPPGQPRPAHAAMQHGERSAPLPPADRNSRPAAIMTAAQATDPAAKRKSKPRRSTAEKIVAQAGKAESPATALEFMANIAPRQQRQHPPVQAHPRGEEHPAPATPARRLDVDGARQIEELRQTFYDLVSKKSMTTGTKDREQTTTDEAQQPPQPPLQQIVVINRTSGGTSRGREPYAFWERSCMARTTLKMIR